MAAIAVVAKIWAFMFSPRSYFVNAVSDGNWIGSALEART
jgi:hypothetical protein